MVRFGRRLHALLEALRRGPPLRPPPPRTRGAETYAAEQDLELYRELSDEALADGQEPVRNALGRLRAGTAAAAPPGVVGQPAPAPADAMGLRVEPTVNALGASSIAGSSSQTNTLSAAGNPSVFNVASTRVSPGSSDSQGASFTRNAIGFNTASTRTLAYGIFSTSGVIGLAPNSVSLGVGTSLGDPNRVGSGWLLGAVSADRAVTDLGAEGTGRRVELKSARGGNVRGLLGWANPTLGVGGALTYDNRKSIIFRTTLSEQEAREALFEEEGKGLVGMARNSARALGMLAERLSVPDLSRPEQMRVGDEVVLGVTGSVAGGVALGGVGVRAGAQAVLQGDFLVEVRKLDATHVRLVVTPKKVHGAQLFFDTLSPLSIDASSVNGSALRQAFVFDLSSQPARDLYLSALKGRLPLSLAVVTPDPDGAGLTRAVRDEDLPAGVERLFAEGVRAHLETGGGGLRLGIFSGIGGFAGLNAMATRVAEERALTDGSAAIEVSARGVESRREVLLSGTEVHGVFAEAMTLVTLTEDDLPVRRFAGLKLRSHYEDTRERKFEINRFLIAPLNQAFGLSLPPHTERSPGFGRTVDVELVLRQTALEQLAKVDEAAAREAATQSGSSPDKTWAMVQGLRGQSAEVRGRVVLEYVSQGGLASMGTLHRLVGAKADRFQLTSSVTEYTGLPAKARTLAFKYPRPVEFSEGPDRIARRFDEVGRVLHRVRVAQDEVRRDALVGSDGPRLLDGLARAEHQLQQLMSLEQLGDEDLRQLYRELDDGWLSGRRAHLRDFLASEGFGSR